MAADCQFRSRDARAPVRRACALQRSTENAEVFVVGDMESSVGCGAGATANVGRRLETTREGNLPATVISRREMAPGVIVYCHKTRFQCFKTFFEQNTLRRF